MGKKTDYKRLWRNSQKALSEAQTEITRLKNLNKGYVDIIEGIKSGKIIIDRKVKKEEPAPKIGTGPKE